MVVATTVKFYVYCFGVNALFFSHKNTVMSNKNQGRISCPRSLATMCVMQLKATLTLSIATPW
jgi:hypothetical protein